MKIIMLGTGSASATKIYHTCFAVENNGKYFIVDAGGGQGILNQLENANISLKDVTDIFLSHIHLDHSLGVLWLLRMRGRLKEKLPPIKVYGSQKVLKDLETLMNIVLKNELKKIGNDILFMPISDGDTTNINNIEYEFVDTNAKKDQMFGFIMKHNNKNIIFIGDETLKENLISKFKNCDLLMHDAFCISTQADDEFLKRTCHTSAKNAGKIASKVNAKSLLLFHTSDVDIKNRKATFTNDAQKEYSGKIYVPDDLEQIVF